MERINILNKHLSELIAAGEVVERPCSVIKELLENSIDAKATAITVEIKNGGISLMKVSDNGTGIFKDDIRKAFLRHATSKISNEKDLDGIKTLGFRGEALASIAAVSKVELFTKTDDSLEGIHYIIEGSSEILYEEVGCTKGLTISIKDLFYNTPARLKFLKKDVTEANAIASVVDKLALSHPNIAFKFIRDGKTELNTPGDGKIESCVYSVYKSNFFQGLIPVKYSLNNINVYGYITKPEFARANRSMQHFFVNRRYVKSKTAMAALEQAFKGSIMASKFPACVLYIEIPYEATDVNVHPAKIEIRFINEKPIFEAVYYAVKSALKTLNLKEQTKFINEKEIKKLKFEQSVPQKLKDPNLKVENKQNNIKKIEKTTVFKEEPNENNSYKKDEPKIFMPNKNVYKSVLKFNDFNKTTNEKPEISFYKDENSNTLLQKNDLIKNSSNAKVKEQNKDEGKFFKEQDDIKFVSEVFSTYVIFENDNDLIFIDKHAAHERILYEKLKSENINIESQMLLTPLTIVLDKNEYSAVIENKTAFTKAGFDVDDFGPGTVIVRAAPIYLENKDISFFISEIAGYILENKIDLNTEYLDWIYHNIACRGAIKAGKKTSSKELISLFKQVKDKNIRSCPHGRPIYVIFKKSDIDKKFGRV